MLKLNEFSHNHHPSRVRMLVKNIRHGISVPDKLMRTVRVQRPTTQLTIKSYRLKVAIAITLAAISIAAVFLLLPGQPEARAEVAMHPASPAAATPAASSGPWVLRAYFTDRAQVDRVAGRIEPREVHYDLGYMVLEVNAEQYQWLLDLGLRVEIDQELTAELNRPHLALPGQTSAIPGYPCYRTVEETFATAQEIANNYPNLATWIDIGDSWKRVAFGSDSGYDMLVLRLTNALVPGPKPKLFIVSSIHAREYAPAELATRFAEYLVSNYGIDPDVTWLLDYHEIHLLLQANPDGRKRAEEGLPWRKNVNNNYCANTDTRGADLNRNFEFQWGGPGSSDQSCDLTYRGLTPVSEPEAQAMQAYMRSIFPDQREAPLSSPAPADATGLFIDLHSWGQYILWPWSFTPDAPPNGDALRTLGRKFAWFNGYDPGQFYSSLYPAAGTTDDFTYGELGVAGYTFELGNQFFQNCSTFENTILPDNLRALLYAAKVARTPYMTPAGPDSLSVVVSPASQQLISAATLSATIDDTRFSIGEPSQNIVAAEYYVDIPPWVTGAGPVPNEMAPLDGSFDETSEDVSASIDTASLHAGRHILYVRGQDSDGNWGPFSAAFLYFLTVSKAGTGSGTVTSDPVGIDCGLDCSEAYATNPVVTLSAVAATGSTFTGWSGSGCSGTGTCVVTLDAAKSVTATFALNTYTLSVNKSGTGSGTVTSNPAGIDCGLDCSQDYGYNTIVTLSASAAAGSIFTGWSGSGCSGTGTCVVILDAAESVTANFTLGDYLLTVSKAGTGSGTVTSDPVGIDCGSGCSEAYATNTVVTLSAAAATGSTFTGWSGSGCSGTGTCVVTLDAAKSVTATFTLNTYTLSVNKSGTGSGTVTSNPAGIDCGLDCSQVYGYNTVVPLSAAAAKGSTFTGWSGSGCSGTGTCVVTMDAAKSVTATFTLTLYKINLPLIFKE